MKNENNLIVVIIATIIIGIAILFATYFTITGFVVQSSNSLEKVIQVEVWADSYIEMEIQQDSILAKVFLDNGTLIEEQELKFYLDNKILYPQNETLFNLSEASPGNYSIKILSQGSSAQYLNPISLEKEIEILEINGTREIILIEELEISETNLSIELNKTNQTLLNITNQPLLNETNLTIENISLEGYICKEFTEQVLWSSGYTNKPRGSTNYQTWYPKYNCTSVNISDCFLGALEIQTRFLYFGENNEQGEGYVQISNPDKLICNNPKEGNYSRYLAYELLIGESRRFGQCCGNNKNFDGKCGVTIIDSYSGNLCYGIKLYADSHFIVDVFEIKYRLCVGENE